MTLYQIQYSVDDGASWLLYDSLAGVRSSENAREIFYHHVRDLWDGDDWDRIKLRLQHGEVKWATLDQANIEVD